MQMGQGVQASGIRLSVLELWEGQVCQQSWTVLMDRDGKAERLNVQHFRKEVQARPEERPSR